MSDRCGQPRSSGTAVPTRTRPLGSWPCRARPPIAPTGGPVEGPEHGLERSQPLVSVLVDNLPPQLYDPYMSELAVSAARDHLAGAIDAARTSGEPVYVTRRGRRVAVIVDSEAYDALVEAAEDTADRVELAAARAEDDFVPWEDVKADLGLR